MARLLAIVGGGVWLLATVIVALGVQWSAHPRIVPRHPTIPALIKELNSAPREGESWIVTKANTAHNVLVVDATADHVSDARAIASQIVEPVKDRGYSEILVYIWKARGPQQYAARRVQWTAAAGYSEMVIDDK